MTDDRERVGELEARVVQLERQLAGPSPERRWRWRAKLAVGAGLVGAVTVSSLAVGEVGDVLREQVRNGTTAFETEIIGKLDAATASNGKGGYVTRQSNIATGAKAGGAAIFGCRGAAGGTAAGSAPCLRASNLADGFAFEFASAAGPAGVFDVGAATDAPFVTDGGGLVANLNADKLDGQDAGAFLGRTDKAADADKLDGQDAGAFLGRTDKAADADKLDGLDSDAFLRQPDVDAFLPVAVINVASDGTLRASAHRAPVTGTPVVTHPSATMYFIDLPGMDFHAFKDAVTCTPANDRDRLHVTSSRDDVLVQLEAAGGFYCSIYELG